MLIASLERAHVEIADAVTTRLCVRPGSIFRRAGELVCRKHVDTVLAALAQDLGSGSTDALRGAVQTLIGELSAHLTFSDLRFFVQTLRSQVGGTLTFEPGDTPPQQEQQQIADWFFELVLVSAMRFTAHREKMLQERAAKLEFERLESQLAELQIALGEKTKLLEMIRQASTPIVPIVRGILVMPLVGMFDTFRAQLLTEKLLHEVARSHARTVILDISGVPVFDTQSAELIVRLARTARMLGTTLFLVGMSPANASTIVGLGIDLVGLETFATLQDGLARALMLQRLEIVPV
jgi:anti-anti-sigma regulatory factor